MENNRLIAEFMGTSEFKKRLDIEYGMMELYETSWDWLMPVVEKIEQNGDVVDISGTTCRINDTGHTGLSKLGAVYDAVVGFLQFSKEQGEW